MPCSIEANLVIMLHVLFVNVLWSDLYYPCMLVFRALGDADRATFYKAGGGWGVVEEYMVWVYPSSTYFYQCSVLLIAEITIQSV